MTCVIPTGSEPSFGKLLDLTIMVIPGGQESTEDEYRKLHESAGFRLSKILSTEAEVSKSAAKMEAFGEGRGRIA